MSLGPGRRHKRCRGPVGGGVDTAGVWEAGCCQTAIDQGQIWAVGLHFVQSGIRKHTALLTIWSSVIGIHHQGNKLRNKHLRAVKLGTAAGQGNAGGQRTISSTLQMTGTGLRRWLTDFLLQEVSQSICRVCVCGFWGGGGAGPAQPTPPQHLKYCSMGLSSDECSLLPIQQQQQATAVCRCAKAAPTCLWGGGGFTPNAFDKPPPQRPPSPCKESEM